MTSLSHFQWTLLALDSGNEVGRAREREDRERGRGWRGERVTERVREREERER